MISTFHKTFKLLLLFSVVISGWTSVLLISNTSFNLEIKEVINKMYLNQKNFVGNLKELSLLLVKDANERFSEKDTNITHLKNTKDSFNK